MHAGAFEIREMSWDEVPEASDRDACEAEAISAVPCIDRAPRGRPGFSTRTLAHPQSRRKLVRQPQVRHVQEPAGQAQDVSVGFSSTASEDRSQIETGGGEGLDAVSAHATDDALRSSAGSDSGSAPSGGDGTEQVDSGVAGAEGGEPANDSAADAPHDVKK